MIYDPVRDEMFAGRRGGGASVNGRPLRVSNATTLADGLVGLGYSNRVQPAATLGPMQRLMEAQGMFHRCGSGALSLAYVAAGRLIGYYEPHMNAWDAVAGALLVREAGGCWNMAVLCWLQPMASTLPCRLSSKLASAASGLHEVLLTSTTYVFHPGSIKVCGNQTQEDRS